MNRSQRHLISDLLRRNTLMRVATIRPDGYPQVTTVTFASDGLVLYFACDRDSQKARNLSHSRKVSLAIDADTPDWNRIQGLSMGGQARVLARSDDIQHASRLLARRFEAMRGLSAEDLAQMAFVRVTPRVIALLDYTRGFGHSELLSVPVNELPARAHAAHAPVP
jgi:pyridoxine/pyridoxamine 5'-phosphate oxidase